jgi:REP element-mobilizing transposase RayT
MGTEPPAGRGEPQLALSKIETHQDQASRGSPLPARLWYHPRNLPHFDAALVTQAITYRLADSLPNTVAQRLADELTPDDEPRYRRRVEAYLDAGHGCCCLTQPVIAQDIIDTWRRFDGERYRLCAWVIMPNHVHVVITVMPGHTLGSIVQSWKSWTGKRIKALTGSISWQRDYWDRYIRDESHFRQTVAYIHENPVKAGLVRHAHDWPWSSATPPGEAPPGEASPSSPRGNDQRLHRHSEDRQEGGQEGDLEGDLEGEQGLASPGGGIVEQAITANLRGLGYGG